MGVQKKRVNIMLPEQVEKYLEKRMDQTGLAKSALVVMAMQEWYEAKINMEQMRDMPALINELKNMQDKMDKRK